MGTNLPSVFLPFDCLENEVVTMTKTAEYTLSKVPEVTLVFWIIKIAATTLGETGGDTVTMTLNWGYLAGTLLFFVVLIALVATQIVAKKFHPSIGPRSPSRKAWARHSVTGWPMRPALDTKAELSYSVPRWRW